MGNGLAGEGGGVGVSGLGALSLVEGRVAEGGFVDGGSVDGRGGERDLGGAFLEEEGVAEDEQVGEEGFDHFEAGLLGVGTLDEALQGVLVLGAAVAVADDELDFGGGGGDFADAGVDDFVAAEAFGGELVEVGGGGCAPCRLARRGRGRGRL